MPAVRKLYVSSRKCRGFKALKFMSSSWMTNLMEIFTNFNVHIFYVLCCEGALGTTVFVSWSAFAHNFAITVQEEKRQN